MTCVLRDCVYATLLGVFVCLQSIAARGKEDKRDKTLNSNNDNERPVNSGLKDQFQWHEHSRLSWDDFRGQVNASTEESAAATHCGIGFRTSTPSLGNNPEVIVYNIFYAKKSWVRSDAKIPSILDHEQGHFDLCEIYTRKLRERMCKLDFGVRDIAQTLMSIYSEVSNDYENRQKAYEDETIHGTNIEQQKKWREVINAELM